jgi:HlyD family secretion protein
MTPQRLIIAVLVLAALGLGGFILLAPQFKPTPLLSGYVESEPLYLASPISGVVTRVAVARGERVDAGALIFTVDTRSLAAQRDEAAAQIAQAKSQVAATTASRAQLEAAVAAARASAVSATRDEDRANRLFANAPGAISRQEVDRARAAGEAARAQLAAAQRQVDAADAQIGAAGGQVSQAEGARADAEARLSLAAAHAPDAARVEDVFFQDGEWAAANQPIVALLPDRKITIRFFVPEREVARYRMGQAVRFACDGCAAGLYAVIDYVSPRPEFTPPVIYSLQSRDRLVFLVEARPANPRDLTPGQPVDVTPLAAGPAR